ncbi:MAG: creatininase family protein [Chloroflexi bacterium]|nr:creatininase family protein [Chloroflexota bacterium]
MLLDYQNTSFEVRDAKPDIALLPVGATERCGSHLPVGASTFILDHLARRVGEQLRGTVYLLPTLPLGTSITHEGTAGTVALHWDTLMAVVTDLVESLLAQGIRRVVVINSLGGANETTVTPRENYIVKTAVRQLNYDHPDLDCLWVQPFTVAGAELRQIMGSAQEDVHAGELATSLLLHLHPDWVRGLGEDWVPDVSKAYLDWVPFDAVCPGGVWGRPSLATAEKGARALEAAVARTVHYIEESFAHLATMKRRLYY